MVVGDPRQQFWLETTDRPDIGVDLHCPQRDTVGNRSPGFSLIWYVEPDDVVFLSRRRPLRQDHAYVGS